MKPASPPGENAHAPGINALPRILDGRFEIGVVLGKGGMATVFRARDLTTGATVAVKVLRDDIVPASGRARFAREVQLTSGMRHPGILEILAAGEANGHPYYVMPLVEGRSLQEKLEDGAAPVAEAVRIAAKVGEALGHAHARGVIHRDIKPANILLQGDQPILADFGIARAIDVATADRLTESGVALGTAHYMSPEQAVGGKVDERSDIYSLACVLYEMLVGNPPFSGTTAQQVLARHATSPVPGMRAVRGTISAELEAVVFRALEKVPADRYATSDEFVDSLRTAPTVAPGPRGQRRGRRRLSIAATAVVVAAVVAAIVATRDRAPGLDPNRVLVLPLVSRSAEAGGASAGEDAATMIGAAIDGVGALRFLDGWRLLDAGQRNDVATLSAGAARALALRTSSAYVLSGRILARGDTLDVVIDLLDAKGDTVVARGTGSAPRGEVWRAALRATNGVLPALMRTAAVDVGAPWSERSPKAVAAYLQGEAAYRRLQMPLALSRFREALGHDSLLTLAALRGAQAAGWSHNVREAGELAHIAQRHPLSQRDAHFARGFAAYVEGRADSAAGELRRALAADSTMGIAWMQLAETFTHLLPHAGAVDSVAGAAFQRAYALDSSAAAPIAYHLAERATREGDAVGAAALLRVMRVANADTLLLRVIELMHRCAESRGRAVNWLDDARTRPLPLVLAATKLAAEGAQLGCAADAFAATLSIDTSAAEAADGRRFAALIGLVGVRHAQGRADSASAEIDRFAARWGYGGSLLLRQSFVDSTRAGRALAMARADSARFGADFRGSGFSNRLWLLGVWAAKDARIAAAEGAARELNRRADSTRIPRDRRYGQSVLAHVAMAKHDTARTMAMLTPLVGAPLAGDEVQWDESASMADERLLLARLHLARGDAARALAVADVFDSSQPAVFLMYLAPSLELRVRAAEALGDNRLAARFKARLASMRASTVQQR